MGPAGRHFFGYSSGGSQGYFTLGQLFAMEFQDQEVVLGTPRYSAASGLLLLPFYACEVLVAACGIILVLLVVLAPIVLGVVSGYVFLRVNPMLSDPRASPGWMDTLFLGALIFGGASGTRCILRALLAALRQLRRPQWRRHAQPCIDLEIVASEVCSRISAPEFATVLTGPRANAWTTSTKGERILYVGLPLLATLSRSELSAVVCHEAAHHFSARLRVNHAYRRLAVAAQSVMYETRAGLEKDYEGLDGANPLDVIYWSMYGTYAGATSSALNVFVLFTRAADRVLRVRRDELFADDVASEYCGGNVLRSALKSINRLQELEHDLVCDSDHERGYGTLPELLDRFQSSPGKPTRCSLSAATESRSHPSLAERLWRSEQYPEALDESTPLLSSAAVVAIDSSKKPRPIFSAPCT